jgi:hypothetical protein
MQHSTKTAPHPAKTSHASLAKTERTTSLNASAQSHRPLSVPRVLRLNVCQGASLQQLLPAHACAQSPRSPPSPGILRSNVCRGASLQQLNLCLLPSPSYKVDCNPSGCHSSRPSASGRPTSNSKPTNGTARSRSWYANNFALSAHTLSPLPRQAKGPLRPKSLTPLRLRLQQLNLCLLPSHACAQSLGHPRSRESCD